MSSLRRVCRRLFTVFRSGRADADLAREIDAHLRLLEDDFVARGMAPDQARSAARRAFGGVEQVKERQRDSRSFRWLSGLPLDLTLGLRMLVTHPALSLVSGIALAVAIAIGAASFAFFYGSFHPTLPLEDGERVVGLENWDSSWNNQEDRLIHDFVEWRAAVKSVQDLAAVQILQRNLVTPDGQAERVPVAEMTASGFRVARVRPLLGRLLDDHDERTEAPPVALLDHDLWRRRFAASPDVLGRTVRLGGRVHTVVGVMPEGFRFPVNNRVWVALQADPSSYQRRRGPGLVLFGRLTPGVTIGEARAELDTIGQRNAAAMPETHARLRPRVVRYTELWFDDEPRSLMHLIQLIVSMLVVVVGANVAILMYARTATRHREILVRTALGATRRRIVAQLLIEALVLAAAAAMVGLLAARWGLSQASAAADLVAARYGGVPFWMHFGLSWGTIVYTVALAVLAAMIAGGLPAIKATGRRTQGIGQLDSGTGVQLGKTWTGLVIIQVAFAVAMLPGAAFLAARSIELAGTNPTFAADEFLVARVVMDEEVPSSAGAKAYWTAFDRRYQDRLTELIRRLKPEPAVAHVTTMSSDPGAEPTTYFEVEGAAAAQDSERHHARYARVGGEYFEAFDVPVLIGRGFTATELDPDRPGRTLSPVVVVNRAFAEHLGGSAVGRRIRYSDQSSSRPEPASWSEIVGVVDDLPRQPLSPDAVRAAVYHPMPPGRENYTQLAIRIRIGTPDSFTPRLRAITTSLDPRLQFSRIRPLIQVYREEQMGLHWAALAVAMVTLSVVFLSTAGVYALMSLAVTRRTREIGIRVALGADRGRLLRSVFSRALAQLVAGVIAGSLVAGLVDALMGGDLMGGHRTILLPAVAVLMVLVGLLAALGPARRGLRINPTEALRAE